MSKINVTKQKNLLAIQKEGSETKIITLNEAIDENVLKQSFELYAISFMEKDDGKIQYVFEESVFDQFIKTLK